MKTTIRPFALCVFLILCLQGCVNYRYPHPIFSPPPHSTAPDHSQPPPHQQEPSLSTPEPGEQPMQSESIGADFSREAAIQADQGRFDLASATLERGLRIAPKDAMLWSQLAEVKLQQGEYRQAKSLATKSNSLAGHSMDITSRNYWIIEEADRRGGDH